MNFTMAQQLILYVMVIYGIIWVIQQIFKKFKKKDGKEK